MKSSKKRHSPEVLHPRLIRGLTFSAAASLVVGTIIGTGIFLKAAIMSHVLGSGWLVLVVWFAAGLLSLAGALTYAEIGGLFPKAGGEYVYLREAYGELPAFLYGWMRFWIGGPGSVAALSMGSATFILQLIPSSASPVEARTSIAVSLIIFFTILNCLSVRSGGKILSAITSVKMLLILGVPLGVFLFSKGGQWSHLTEATGTPFTFSAFGTAMLAALWAFDGWNNLPMMAGEVQNPEVNVPRALIVGTGIVVGVYALVNLAYFFSLPIREVAAASSKLNPEAPPVAALVVQTFLGTKAKIVFSVLLVVSALGAMNGSVMSSSRVPYALAKDGLFPKFIGEVSQSTHVPYLSLMIQAAIAIMLALTGSYDRLTDYVVFASWIFYALVAYSLFIFRRKLPNAERQYRALGYPYIPILFIGTALLLVINSLLTSFIDSAIGLFIILSGVPVYYRYFKK